MFKQTSRRAVALALVLALAMVFTFMLSACGGGGGNLSGFYVPLANHTMSSTAPYSSFDFHGKNVTVGLIGGLQSHECGFTFDGSTLSMNIAGSAVNVQAELKDVKVAADGTILEADASGGTAKTLLVLFGNYYYEKQG